MGNRTLLRSDGSKVLVPDAEAEKLLSLGYREETPTQEMEAGIGRGIENFYTSPDQQVTTGIEGLYSGASLGLTDLATGSDAIERAHYNPGTRLASEVVGSLLPLTPGGIGKAFAFTPAGLLEKGAAKIGQAVGGGSKVIDAMARTTVEGAGFGAGAALTTAQLNGDPITAEAIGAGMGWGALFGGGLGALGAGIEAKMESRAARALQAEEGRFASIGVAESAAAERAMAKAKVNSVVTEGMRTEHGAISALEEGHYQHFATTVGDAVTQLKQVNTAVETAKDLNFTGLRQSQRSIYSQLADNTNLAYVRPEARAFTKEFSAAQLAAKEGKYEKMVGHLEKFKENMAHIEIKLGGAQVFNSEKVIGQANDLIGLAKYRMDTATKAAEELASMEAIRGELNGFPKTAQEFVGMTPARVEKLTAAIDHLGKIKSAEMAGVQEAVRDAVTHMGEGLGIKLEGTPGAQMQGMWKMLKDSRTKRASDELRAAKDGNLLWSRADQQGEKAEFARMRGGVEKDKAKAKSGAQRAMESAARYGVGSWAAQRAGTAGYILGSSLVTGLVGLKCAILGTIAEKAKKWIPKAARGMQVMGSRAEPLARRIDGTEEQGKKDRMSLMQARAKEINEAAPVVRDTLYRSVQPLAMAHPELAAAMHKDAVKRFQFLMGKLPKDPGLAFSNLKSLWRPDPVAVEKFSRYYDVFHDPVGVMTRALTTGKISMEAAEGLKEMNPELWQTLRVHLLERISDPEVRGKMKYEDQVHVGLMIGIPVHSTMNPQFIAAQQQMYTERNQPLEMSPRVQPGGGAGRPSGPGPSATAGQRISEH